MSERQASAEDEIEITHEMIEAGLRMYWYHLPYEAGKESHDRKKVVDIFNAMLAVRKVRKI